MNTYNTEIKIGIAVGFSGFLWLLMEKALGLHDKNLDFRSFIFWLIIVLPMAGIFFLLSRKRDKVLNGSISLLQCIKANLVFIPSTLITHIFFVWLYISVINPNFLTIRMDHELKIIRSAQIDIEAQLIEEGEIKEAFTTATFLVNYFLVSLIICLVLGLAISLILRKQPLNAPIDSNKNVS
ncbi:MAG: DUF4199 domain-containing protein [Bacteroidia bacterium]|jgi:hypothetical protein